MNLTSAAFHVFGAIGRTFGRILLWFVILLIIGGGAVEVVGRVNGTPNIGTHIAAVVVGLLAGYAAALTIVVGEVVRVLIAVIQTVDRELKGAEGDAGKVLQSVEAAITGGRK